MGTPALMGYAKTVQVLRGLSCYKPTKRLKQDKITKEYQEKLVDPSYYMDAALPVLMDITVLQSPEGVSPRQIAMVVMGLRLGYAHYSDWNLLVDFTGIKFLGKGAWKCKKHGPERRRQWRKCHAMKRLSASRVMAPMTHSLFTKP